MNRSDFVEQEVIELAKAAKAASAALAQTSADERNAALGAAVGAQSRRHGPKRRDRKSVV